MSLPSGYKKLEYIQSSGTQYINTGFKPNQNTKIELDVLSAEGTSSNIPYIFGTQDSSNNYFVATWVLGYGNGMVTTGINLYDGKFHVVKVENGALYKDGSIIAQGTVSSFSIGVPIFLFAVNSSRQSMGYGACKLRSCKIYDNGTLVRDFIPCKNASGVIGLWDDVNSTFYSNAGSGTFTAGPEVIGSNRVLVDAKGYDANSGTVLVNGMVYHLKKGRGLLNGMGYDIPFDSGTQISEIPVGNIVKIAVNGTLRDFLIVHQGLPSSMYDDSCNGTWLLMKEIYTRVSWAPSYAYNYSTSTINNYLNSDFLNLLDSSIKDVIQQVKIPYYRTNGGLPDIQYGANGVSCKIFLLSGYEVGWSYDVSMQFPEDGAKLSYFESGTSTSANNKRVATDGRTGWQATKTWWLRSDYTANLDKAWYVQSDGTYDHTEKNNSPGCRPAFILPFDTLVSDDGTITT